MTQRIYATQLDSKLPSHFDIDLADPVALVFGNEHLGVSNEAITEADGAICIPQVGMVASLNISVACAVVLYEAYRQRDALQMYDQRPSTYVQDYNRLLEDYLGDDAEDFKI